MLLSPVWAVHELCHYPQLHFVYHYSTTSIYFRHSRSVVLCRLLFILSIGILDSNKTENLNSTDVSTAILQPSSEYIFQAWLLSMFISLWKYSIRVHVVSIIILTWEIALYADDILLIVSFQCSRYLFLCISWHNDWTYPNLTRHFDMTLLYILVYNY